MFKNIEAFIVWLQLTICCMVVLCVIGASKLYPEGKTDNIVAQFFLRHVTVQTVIEDDIWSVKYPFDESELQHYLSMVKKIEKSIENYCTTSFPGGGTINKVVSWLKTNVMHYDIASIPNSYDNQRYANDCAENVNEFKKNVNDLGIPFFYVQTPSQAGIDYYVDKSLIESKYFTIAERSYLFTNKLESDGIDVINYNRDMYAGVTFDDSGHWKPHDGLECAKIISNKLNKDYGFSINMSSFDDEKFFDLLQDYPEIKQQIEEGHGYQFSLPCPKYDINYKMIYAEESEYEGSFEEVLLRPMEEWRMDDVAYHLVFRLSNSLIYDIYNSDALCDKTVLIIGDSFNWPVSSYLSLGLKEVCVVNNSSFTGSIMSYIKQKEPDAVIVVYHDAEFYSEIVTDAFDFR